MFIVYHMTWDRKPCYSALIFDGIFPTWEDAFRACFNNIINGDIDPGEILDGTEPPPLFYTGVIPETAQELKNSIKAEVHRFIPRDFADFSSGDKRFHIKYLP